MYVELVETFYRYANTVSKRSEDRQFFSPCKLRKELCSSIWTIFLYTNNVRTDEL